jgi:hypothetical protein
MLMLNHPKNKFEEKIGYPLQKRSFDLADLTDLTKENTCVVKNIFLTFLKKNEIKRLHGLMLSRQ